MRRLFCLLVLASLVITVTSFCSRRHEIYGLYKCNRSTDLGTISKYLLFKKRGEVRFIEKLATALTQKDVNKNGSIGKYTMINDSVFLHFDSLYVGENTISFTVYGKYHHIITNQYESYKTDFKGILKNDSFICNRMGFVPHIIKNDWGGITINGKSDTTLIYFEKYSKCR